MPLSFFLFWFLIFAIFLLAIAILVRTNIIIKNQEEASEGSIESAIKQLDKFIDMGVIPESEYDEKLQILRDYYEKKLSAENTNL